MLIYRLVTFDIESSPFHHLHGACSRLKFTVHRKQSISHLKIFQRFTFFFKNYEFSFEYLAAKYEQFREKSQSFVKNEEEEESNSENVKFTLTGETLL